jgi:iron complex outermembrane receptor protein
MVVALLGAWFGRAFAQDLEPGAPVSFHINPGTLIEAIKQFSEQTGVQITADLEPPGIQDHPVVEINESLAPQEALTRLLDGTGLAAQWHSRKTVRIYPVIPPHGYGNVNEIVVTGSRISDVGEGPAPVRVYTREEIDRLGVSSVAALAGYFTQQPFSFGEWAQRTGAQHFQMRGLGVDTTLVLINGRRAPPSATSVTLNAFDLNAIPITAVDRIEVMSDSTSAIYGADAIGGVVNIILKKEVTSPEVFLHYGSAEGGARERRVAVSVGSSSERLKTALTLDYFERGMLIGDKRDFWRNQDFRRFGGTDWRVPTANPANIYSLDGAPLPGLESSFASVPTGSSGIGLAPEDFRETDGVLSLDSPYATTSIVPNVDRQTVFGTGQMLVGRNAAIFGEALVSRSNIVSQGGLPVLNQQEVAAENPYNPFGQSVLVDYRFVGMRPISYATEAELARFVLGARGALNRWDWEFVLTKSDENVGIAALNDVDPGRVQAALSSSDPRMALNPFVDGPGGDTALLASLLGEPRLVDAESGGLQFSAFVRRQAFQLPGGASEFVLGGEWRRERIRFVGAVFPVTQKRDVASGFFEAKFPLLQELWVKVALRGDYYDNAEDSANPQYGLVWKPAQDWLMRAAYGTSFRPPSVLELFTPRADFMIPVADLRRGGAVSQVRWISGGNPALENISARSFTGGVLYRPDSSSGLQLGVQYWWVAMDGQIIVPRPTDIEALEALGHVTRLVPSDADVAAGRPGVLQSVDGSLLNYGRLKTSGIDVDLSYRTRIRSKSLKTTLSATWVDECLSYDLSPVNGLDRVGVARIDGTIPEWRLVGAVALEGNVWGISATAAFIPSYQDADLTGLLGRRLPSRTILDFQAWYEPRHLFGVPLRDGLKVTAGALNLLDEDVDFANVGLGLGFDPSVADLRKRFAYLRITKGF